MSKSAPHPVKRRRHFGKRSPLDRLPPPVRNELRKRCLRGDVFREIQQWLRKQHRCPISIQSLSEWNIRRNEEARLLPQDTAGSDPVTRICSGDCEIIITAPGASEVRVRLRSLRPVVNKQAATQTR